MIHHLRARALSILLETSSHLPAPQNSLCRLLSTAASASPNPFVVEDYLVTSCGLTRAKALKASRSLSHLKSPSNADAVLAFLSDLGMAPSEIATLVARDPPFLCSSVEKTLAPRVAQLRDLGMSLPQIARLLPLALSSFRTRNICGNLSFWLSAFDGSFETLFRSLRKNSAILKISNIEKAVMPNIAFLRQCGIGVSKVAIMDLYSPRVFSLKPKSLREAAERVEELGIKVESRMFRHALVLVAFMSKEDVAKKKELLHKTGFSQDEVSVMVRRFPFVLRMSEERIRNVMHFLTKDVGLEAPYIAHRPAMFGYSLERRLLPRYFLLKVLREKGLLNVEYDYYYIFQTGEKAFVQKFVHPYKDHVPGLTDDYASICSWRTA